MKAYKGFDKDLKCRGFQYEIGKEYEEKEAEACEKGFHACENPLEVFRYYPPCDGNRYCEVEQDGELSKHGGDSKVASTKIKIGVELGLKGLIQAGVSFILDKVNWKADAATNTDAQSAAVNLGYRSAATNTGDLSAAMNTGDYSAVVNSGDYSAAMNTGYRSAAVNSGDRSAAVNTGDYSAVVNSGDYSAAMNTGYRSAAVNSGDRSAAVNTGDYSAVVNSGIQSAVVNSGIQSAAVNSGIQSAAVNSGIGSAAVNSGTRSAAEVSNGDSVAIVTGYNSKAKAGLGSAIVIAERGDWNGKTYPLNNIKAAIVDGEKIKADTWYTLKNGEFVECD